MFGKPFVRDLIEHSTENETDRRRFLQSAGVAGLGVVGASLISASAADAATPKRTAPATQTEPAGAPSDGAVLNFALNLEYLEAEFYHRAYTGHGLPDNLTGGKGDRGHVTGGHEVPFKTKLARDLAHEITGDEKEHVKFLRDALGAAKVARPAIDLKSSFTAAARAAGLIGAHDTFDPYANENNFLLAAFIFEDVGVSAYKGAAPLISNKAYLEAAAGILAVEAYHASALRIILFERGLTKEANAISAARDSLDGRTDDDRPITRHHRLNLAPTNHNGIALRRTAPEVLNVVYLTPKRATKGGFFPHGVHGEIRESADNG